MYLLSIKTHVTPVRSAGSSIFEETLQMIPTLQEELGRKELQNLASTSSRCKAVVDSSYLWKRQLSRSLGANITHTSPSAGEISSTHNENISGEYKNIVRGLNIIDGRTGRRVTLAHADGAQRASVTQAIHFLETRVPGYLDAVSSRNRAHTTVYNDEATVSIYFLATVALGLITASTAALVYSVYYGLIKVSPKKRQNVHPPLSMLCQASSKSSKFLCRPEMQQLETFVLIISVGAYTHRCLSQLRLAWDARQRTEAAAALQQRIAVLRASKSPV